MSENRITMADVAREAGCSTASVSYFVNGKEGKLSEKTRKRIAEVIKETGYVPNAQAQTLASKNTHVIAILILDNTNQWAGHVLDGMEHIAHQNGYQTVVCTSNFKIETELMYVEKMLSLGVDGFIIQPTNNFRAVAERINKAGRPVVFFDCMLYSPGSTWIKTNLYDGVYAATEACIEAGYQDFLAIAADMTQMRTRMERFQGFVEALASHGLPYNALSLTHESPTVEELRHHFEYKLNPAHRTLIFAQNQWALPRVYKALQPMAHLMPQQIGLIGLNCEEWTDLTTPTITTVIEPVHEEGEEAAQMLIDILAGNAEQGRQVVLDCHTNWLASTSVQA